MEALLPISPLRPSSSSSPFATAPSSPRIRETSTNGPADDFPHAIYFSAPTSPARTSSVSFVPFSWEEGEMPKEDFEFQFSGELDFARQSASAEELFESGSWIRPLKHPPRLQSDRAVPTASMVSPRRHPEFSCGNVSPRCKLPSPAKFGCNPVEAVAVGISRRDAEDEEEGQETPLMGCYNRGRDRKAVQGSVSRREMRSLPPPLRLSDVIFENSIEDESTEGSDRRVIKSETRAMPYLDRLMWLFGNTQGYGDNRRWRLRDLLLFRSVSEGTGTRNLRRKEDTITKRDDDGARAGDSFRSKEDSVGSTNSRRNRNRARQSTVSRSNSVELHYTMNRAMSEEMKRKTFLPYRRGVLGCLGLGGNAGGRDLAQGVGSLTRGQ